MVQSLFSNNYRDSISDVGIYFGRLMETKIPAKLPFLEAICWQTRDVYQFTPEQMLRRYERGWKYRTLFGGLEETELNFLRELAQCYKSWLQIELN